MPEDVTPTTMWEVRVVEGRLDELAAWVSAAVAESASIYRSDAPDPRLVVIDPTGQAGSALADVPAHLLARPAFAWDFTPVPRPVRSAVCGDGAELRADATEQARGDIF